MHRSAIDGIKTGLEVLLLRLLGAQMGQRAAIDHESLTRYEARAFTIKKEGDRLGNVARLTELSEWRTFG